MRYRYQRQEKEGFTPLQKKKERMLKNRGATADTMQIPEMEKGKGRVKERERSEKCSNYSGKPRVLYIFRGR